MAVYLLLLCLISAIFMFKVDTMNNMASRPVSALLKTSYFFTKQMSGKSMDASCFV